MYSVTLPELLCYAGSSGQRELLGCRLLWVIPAEPCECSSLPHPTVALPWASWEWKQLVSGGYPSAGCPRAPSVWACWPSRCGSHGPGAGTAYWSAPAAWGARGSAAGTPARQGRAHSLLTVRMWVLPSKRDGALPNNKTKSRFWDPYFKPSAQT